MDGKKKFYAGVIGMLGPGGFKNRFGVGWGNNKEFTFTDGLCFINKTKARRIAKYLNKEMSINKKSN